MPFLQDVIHKLDVGGGLRIFRAGLTVLALLGAIVLYDWRAFRNLGTLEAMDAAQVARNLAQGQGYSTLFVRPFSIYLITRSRGCRRACCWAPSCSGGSAFRVYPQCCCC